MKTVYLTGKMTGAEGTFMEVFSKAEAMARALGYEVFNPATFPGNADRDWGENIMFDLPYIRKADILVIVGGNWATSIGSNIEILFAQGHKKPVFPISKLPPVAKD